MQLLRLKVEQLQSKLDTAMRSSEYWAYTVHMRLLPRIAIMQWRSNAKHSSLHVLSRGESHDQNLLEQLIERDVKIGHLMAERDSFRELSRTCTRKSIADGL